LLHPTASTAAPFFRSSDPAPATKTTNNSSEGRPPAAPFSPVSQQPTHGSAGATLSSSPSTGQQQPFSSNDTHRPTTSLFSCRRPFLLSTVTDRSRPTSSKHLQQCPQTGHQLQQPISFTAGRQPPALLAASTWNKGEEDEQ